MNLQLIESNDLYYQLCIRELWNSDLGKTYFKNVEDTKKTLDRIVGKEKLLIAVDDGQFIGFISYSEAGMFSGFPYIQLFVIAENVRNKGYGNKVLDVFENAMRISSSKVFLLVGDFNSKAQSFYEKRGYLKVGSIPNFHKEAVTEHLMMKVLK